MSPLSVRGRGSRILRNFFADSRGTVAIMLGLSALPLFLAAGVAIDTARVTREQAAFAAAVDSAALAIAASDRGDLTGLTESQKQARLEELEAYAATYIGENYTPQFNDDTVIDTDLEITDTEVLLGATHDYPMTIMKLAGIQELSLNAFSEVTKSGNSIEVALVLDNTGSMAGTKITDLKAAANKFIDTVVSDDQIPFYSKVAIVPYSMGVNVDTYATAARGSINSGTSTTPGSAKFRFTNREGNQRTYDISTCVSERTGSNAYTDAAVGTSPVGRVYPPPDKPCLSSKLQPLTSDKPALHASINAMEGVGSTAGQVGIAWGWYTLSPNIGLWSGSSAPAAYNAERLKKIMILMTDGEYNTNYCKGVRSNTSIIGAGGAASTHINCPAPNGNFYTQAETMCAALKAQGIIVYTVEFELLNTTAAQNLVKNCASGGSFQYPASDSSKLEAAFEGIAKSLLALRLSK